MAQDLDVEALEAICGEVRAYIEKDFIHLHHFYGTLSEGDVPSTNMCRLASVALMEILPKVTGEEWVLVGGWSEEPEGYEDVLEKANFPGGMMNLNGEWKGHYWLRQNWDPDRLDDPHYSPIMVDITADQFGHPPVIVTQENDSRYRSNVCPMSIDAEIGDYYLYKGKCIAERFLEAHPHLLPNEPVFTP